ncbi:MAG: hypothetical protein GAK32_02737 [Pseudomonas fluorescens]|nr:MAG: hypothetical protein GAK32_02737 [Pseudomonas fluorescens]
MSTTVSPAGNGPSTPKNFSSAFDAKLDTAKSSKTIADYMRQKGKSAITKQELSQLANDTSGKVPKDVSDAAKYMERHPDVFTAIETHDVPGADNLSGVWNFDWAAAGGTQRHADRRHRQDAGNLRSGHCQVRQDHRNQHRQKSRDRRDQTAAEQLTLAYTGRQDPA